ncbi:MAG: right-handed parallel beta-helix repeat-containing protein [Kouleothrix sp.]|nr:right-handed parallel beta-helix repeat-containing protein [Kouleothrix sp.]
MIDRAHPAAAWLRLAAGLVLLALVALSLWAARVAQASTISVTTIDDAIAGDGKCSLREAIQAANLDAAVDACVAGAGPDTISLPAGAYRLTIGGIDENSAATGDLDITGDLTITGELSSTTTVDGSALDRVFDVVGAARVTLANLTIQGGAPPAGREGGGIRSTGRLTLTSSAVISNTVDQVGGGGIRSLGTLTVAGSVVSNNTAHSGGGIASDGGLAVSDSTIDDNIGGGIASLGEATVDRSRLRRNQSDSSGGGIAGLGGALTIRDSAILSNTSELGGGVRSSGALTIARTVIAGNTGEIGGGLANDSSGPASLVDSTIASNSGSGIDNFGALTVVGSTISGNTGAGMFNDLRGTLVVSDSTIAGNADSGASNRGALSLSGSTISGNTAQQDGGGIANTGTLVAVNSTISGNSSPGNGGGIANGALSAALNNVTIANNVADSFGDGLADGGGVYNGAGGAVSLKNSIIAANVDMSAGASAAVHPDCSGPFVSLGHNLIGDRAGGACSGLLDGVGGDLVGDRAGAGPLDPQLGPLQDNGGPTATHALLPGSPALDAGSPLAPGCDGSSCAPVDQRGGARPQGPRCDIGAYERATPPTIGGLAPALLQAGGPAFTLVVTGTNFVAGSTVLWNGAPRATQYVSASRLTAAIPASDIAAPGQASVTVANPPPAGGTSNPATVDILQPGNAGVFVFLPLIAASR